MGEPLENESTLGPLVDAKSAEFVRGQVSAARAAGAKQLLGDADLDVPNRSDCYLAPQVLVDVNHDMALMHEETIGPAIGIMRVANEAEGPAWTGVKDSGFGYSLSTLGFSSVTRPKSYHLRKQSH